MYQCQHGDRYTAYNGACWVCAQSNQRRTPDTMTILRRILAYTIMILLTPKVTWHAIRAEDDKLDTMAAKWYAILRQVDPEGGW